MSDKEIIIDGVDVSRCALLCVNNKCKVALEHRELHPKDNLIKTSCEGNNCYYKQLQKAKQDIEAYKLEANEAKEIIAELEHKNNQLKEENVFLNQTLKACEKEHRKLTKKYNELVNQL